MTNTVDLLAEALARLGRPDAGMMLRNRWHAPSRLRPQEGKSSRQKQHEAFARALATAIAGSLVLATEHRVYADLVLSPEFGDLHPYNPECWAKFEHIARTGRTGNPDGWAKLWDRAAALWVSESPKIHDYPIDQLGIFNAMMATSGAPVLLFGNGYRQQWRRLWKRASASGAVAQPYARNCIALLGSHTGDDNAHVAWLLSDENRSLEIADLLLFVRTDRSGDLRQLFARVVRNELGALSDYLLPSRPTATLTALFRYVRTTMRRPSNFWNVGLVLATLSWAAAGIDLARRFADEGVITERDRATLVRGLATTEQVQRMEKNRFWQVVEQIPPGPVRTRIQRLWSEISARRLAIPPG